MTTLFGKHKQEYALVLITMFWGGTFPIIHYAVSSCGPFFFVGLRFLAAALCTALVFRHSIRGMTRQDLRAGLVIGSFAFGGYFLQTYGLTCISSSQSAFLTALYVPLVPIFQWAVMKQAPRAMQWLGVCCAFTGLLFMSGGGSFTLERGQVATLLSAVTFAGEIVAVSVFAGKVHLQRVTLVQLLTVSLYSFLLMPVAGETVPTASLLPLLAALGLGATTALIQLTINWAQRTISPTRATLIYASEPVWGGVFGFLYGDRLGLWALVGAACIVAGVLISEWKPHLRRHAPTS